MVIPLKVPTPPRVEPPSAIDKVPEVPNTLTLIDDILDKFIPNTDLLVLPSGIILELHNIRQSFYDFELRVNPSTQKLIYKVSECLDIIEELDKRGIVVFIPKTPKPSIFRAAYSGPKLWN